MALVALQSGQPSPTTPDMSTNAKSSLVDTTGDDGDNGTVRMSSDTLYPRRRL